MKENDICHKCRRELGFVRKDDGSHTAIIKNCYICGKERPILSARHWVKSNV